jgi:hypothetical protein
MKYLEDPTRQQVILQQLYTTLLKEHNLLLSDTTQIPIVLLTPEDLKKKTTFQKNSYDNRLIHLYINCLETTPFNFFLQNTTFRNDSVLIRRSLNVIHLSYFLLNYRNELIEENELAISLTHKESESIGIPFNRFYAGGSNQMLSTTANGFTESIKAGIQYLLNPTNTTSLLELKVPPAYYYNNFITPETYQSSQTIEPRFQNNSWQFQIFNYASSTMYKSFNISGGYVLSNSAAAANNGGGIYKSNTAISSITFTSPATFNAGTVLVYGVK